MPKVPAKKKATAKSKATKATKGKAKGKGKATDKNPAKDAGLTQGQAETLKVLAGEPVKGDGLTRADLQAAVGRTTTGYPKLIELGYAEEATYEGSRAKYFKVTSTGRKVAKKL